MLRREETRTEMNSMNITLKDEDVEGWQGDRCGSRGIWTNGLGAGRKFAYNYSKMEMET